MNVKGNKRRKETIRKAEKAFLELIQTKNVSEISVSELCEKAKISRTTFYALFDNMNELAELIKERMFYRYLELWKDETNAKRHSYNYLKMFKLIRENQLYFKTMMKLDLDFTKYYNLDIERNEAIRFYGNDNHMDYHIEFFKAGMNAIVRKWLDGGCKEAPEEMAEILRTEYQKKNAPVNE